MIETLLGDVSTQTFFAQHFLIQPMAMPGGAEGLAPLAQWPTVEALLRAPDADALAARTGERWNNGASPPADEARALFEQGYTLLVRHAERHDEGLCDLAEEFRADFGAPVDVHLYATPANAHGFGWHYDAEDVFILQTQGRKEYLLRKNTVNPWPVVETLPADMRYDREIMPLMKCVLEAGDWLYIPNGYWHRAEAKTDSISLAVGVLPATGLDVLDAVRERLLHSMLWRQRLPAPGRTANVESEDPHLSHRQRLEELAADLSSLLQSDAFLRILLQRMEDRSRLAPPPPEAGL